MAMYPARLFRENLLLFRITFIQGGPEIVGQNQGLDWVYHKDEKNSHKR